MKLRYTEHVDISYEQEYSSSQSFLLFCYEGLVEIVEHVVREEHASSPNKPIYLVGDSLGGCLALAVAARNPTVDLVLILANPGQSVEMHDCYLVSSLLASV